MASTLKTESSSPAAGNSPQTSNGTRVRGKSFNLGADPRGDTGGLAIATSNIDPSSYRQTSPPATPVDGKSPGKPVRERKRKKAKKLFIRWKRMSLRHTWVNPLVLVLIVLAAYFASPGEHNPLHSAIFLSYPNPPLNERTNTIPAHVGNPTQYGKGKKDFAFVAFYTIVLSFTREFLMQRMIRPIALYCGIRSRGKQARFMEQFYTALYFAVFGPFGLFVMSRTPVWYFNTAGMYEGFPHRAHEAYFKAYYLLQAAYWAQQGLVLVLLLEKPRKDFKELVLHHMVTLALIGLSYRFHFTYMGIAVYVTHDISDFFLATSKILNYIDSSFTGPYFVLFMGIWGYLRHYINLTILNSLIPAVIGDMLNTRLPPVIVPSKGFATGEFATVGPFELDWETQQYKCWISQAITFALLAILQAVNIFWFVLIIRILYRFLFRSQLKDERSDDEGEDEELAAVEDVPEEKPQAQAVASRTNGHVTKPQVLVNGKPVPHIDEAEVPATGVQSRPEKTAVRRKR